MNDPSLSPEASAVQGVDGLRQEVIPQRRSFKVTLLVMTLDEIDGMKAIMPKIKPGWVDQILIVDGQSTDGSIEWAREHGYEVYVQQRPGFRAAYQEVWPRIRGDVVIYFTPDGNSLPEAIPKLLAKMEEGFDLAIASRYLDGAVSYDDDLVTRFGNWMFRTLANRLLRPNGRAPRITDPLVMLRAHRRDLPQRLGIDRPEPFVGLERIFRAPVDWIPLMSMRAMTYGIKWCEISADEPARIGGKRKLKVFQWGSVYLLQLLREAWFSKGLPVKRE
jgi:glycosyltransferase involved in cell wall biosynthesis